MTPDDNVGQIVATYDYLDEDGKLRYQVCRYSPKGFRQRRPGGNGEYIWNLDGVQRVPYRLPELKAASMQDFVFVVEGEKDSDRLIAEGFTATTNSGGAGKWQAENNQYFRGRLVAIIGDNDGPGKKHARQVADALSGIVSQVRIVELPNLPDKGDVSDWLDNGGTKNELIRLTNEAKPFMPSAETETEPQEEPVDVSQFELMTIEELKRILNLTIKADNINKVLVFFGELSAFTESAQQNISFNAPSSTGKTYIPLEVAWYFPVKDVIIVGYCSPTAFFHDQWTLDKQSHIYTVDLSRKILIFLDQPHTMLLQHLRPLLSHDQKEIYLKITDRSQKSGLRTKTICLRGFPVVIFCTAGLKVDEQESTRFLLLSPETTQNKLQEAVLSKIEKEADFEKYRQWLDNQPERKLLRERVRAIKLERINDVVVPLQELISRIFANDKIFRPRDTRDTGRVISLIKSITLLNCWFRKREDAVIYAEKSDIEEGFKLWESIAESQVLGIPPYIYTLYQEIVVPCYDGKNAGRNKTIEDATGERGLERTDILRFHSKVYGRLLNPDQLRKEILPMMEQAGLIVQEDDPLDKRKRLIFPAVKYRGLDLGVTNNAT